MQNIQDKKEITFESLRSKGQVLNYKNLKLLQTIHEKKPQSLSELVKLTGRQKSNLSRTLKTLEQHGLVSLIKNKKNIIPKAVLNYNL